MDLILWRHAEAEEGVDDLARALTRRGQQQASRMASWLRNRLPEHYVLLASEARRSQQTAAYLAKSYEVLPELNPG
ncbi:histidine phosphatase family protein, partial [Chromobacterium piscinae]